MNLLVLPIIFILQTLPLTRTLIWDSVPDSCLAADPTSIPCPVLNYVVSLDGVVIGSPVVPSQGFIINQSGKHTFLVTAVNIFGSSPNTTQAFYVLVPNKPTNIKVQ